jgi:hypothetical protein
MDEVPPKDLHRREAVRYARLAELTDEPSLKQKLNRIAALHERVAIELGVVEGIRRSQQTGEREPYRLYFHHGKDRIAIHAFEAETDIAALALAYALQEACSDLCDRFELWRGLRIIARSADRRGTKRLPHLEEIAAQMQATVLEQQRQLLRSRQVISKSRKLLVAMEQLRSKLGSRT